MEKRGGACGAPDDTGLAEDVLGSSLAYFMGAARNISNSTDQMLHEDMVQGAIIKFFEVERVNPGGVTNIRQYIVTVMRNAAIDAARSPHSKVMLSDLENLAVPELERGYVAADCAAERAIVRRALGRLSADHREVLLGYVDGLRPRDLASDLNRDPGAVSALHSRAKAALRRSTLIVLLSSGGRACRANAERLPSRVQLELEMHTERDSGFKHIRGCHRCKTNWRRFSLLISAFGAAPLATIDHLMLPVAPATATSGMKAGKTKLRRYADFALVSSVVAMGVAAVVIMTPSVQNLLFSSKYDFQVRLIESELDPSLTALSVRLEALDGTAWKYTKLVLRTPDSNGRFAALEGWECEQTAHEMTCIPEEDTSAKEVELCITGTDAALRETDYQLELSISAGLAWYRAYAWGRF